MGLRLAMVWLFLFAVFSFACASDALILIRRENAGPNLPAALESHPNWVLWPPTYPPQTENGLLSIFTGQDWIGDPRFLQFTSKGKAQWVSQGYELLEKSGYLDRKSRFLKGRLTPLVTDASGDSSPEATFLSLGLDQPSVFGTNLARIKDQDAILVCQARTWDDVAYVIRRCGGKALVVEFPPANNERWSRFWMLGNHWPDLGIPNSADLQLTGLVHARDLAHLFLGDQSLNWSSAKQSPNPWLVRTIAFSPAVRALYLAVVFLLLAFGSYLVRTERTSSFYRSCLLLAIGLPGIDLIAGSLGSVVGLSAWIVIVPTLSCALLGLLASTETLFPEYAESNNLHLQVVSGLGLIACLVSNPFHSDYSPVLSGYGGPGYEVLGFTGAYGLGVLLSVRKWNLRFTVICLMLGFAWFRVPDASSCPELMIAPLAMIATLPVSWIAAVLMIPLAWLCSSQALELAWRPFGLIGRESDLVGLDLSGIVFQLMSIPILIFVLVAASLGVSTLGFAQHQLRAAFRKDPLAPALLTLALYLLLCSLAIPGMLATALVVMLGCALVTCYVATA